MSVSIVGAIGVVWVSGAIRVRSRVRGVRIGTVVADVCLSIDGPTDNRQDSECDDLSFHVCTFVIRGHNRLAWSACIVFLYAEFL